MFYLIPEMKYWFNLRYRLECKQDCLYFGSRLVIPFELRKKVLKIAHASHLGVAKMQDQANQVYWWPGINTDFERTVGNCEICSTTQRSPAKSNWSRLPEETEPWARVHVDFTGDFRGTVFMLLIDSSSRWLEVVPMKNITSTEVINQLRKIFLHLGLPKTIVSDNGPSFVSEEFRKWCKGNQIKHLLTAPYSPQSNGLVERAVQSFKKSMVRLLDDGNSRTMTDALATFLYTYRNVRHSGTGLSPSEIFLRRRLRTRFSIL